MLTLHRLVPHAALALALCTPGAPLLQAQTAAAPQQSIAAPLLSPASFTALGGEAKSIYLQGVIAHWKTSGDPAAIAFVQAAVDSVVAPDGSLRVPPAQAQPFGPAILLSFRISRNPTFYRASKQLRDILQPQQDKGDISSAPFLADFGVTFGEAAAAEQAAAILLRVDTSERNLETGLLQGSDLARNTFYALDLIGTIDRLPIGFHHRRGLTEALNKTVSALIARHDNHAVWQTPGQAPQTLLLNAYIVAHAVRLGELAESDATLAQQMAQFAHSIPLSSEVTGAQMLAQSEILQAPTQAYGQGKTVVADAWFNAANQPRVPGSTGVTLSKWDDDADKGFSFFGYALQRYGMQLDALRVAPTASSLSSAQLYLIAPSDAPGANASHAVTKQDSDAVETWVKDGGVLILVAGDTQEKGVTQLNSLSDRFGMHFSKVGGKRVQGDSGAAGVTEIPPGNTVLPTSHRLFVDATSSLTLTPLAHPILANGDGAIIAVASVGRGTVFAVAGPWFSNKDVDGRRVLPPSDNFAATIELAGWLLKQTQQ